MAERIKSQFDGRKAVIIGDYPHALSIVECLGCENTNIGLGLVFKNIDTYEEFFVFDPKNVQWIKEKGGEK